MADTDHILPLLAQLQRRLGGDVSLAALAALARRSRFQVHRAFRRAVGETLKQYTLRVRVDRAAAELLAGGRGILEIALDAGFASHEVFTRAFRRRFGMAPRAYRERGLEGASPEAVATHAAVVREVAPCVGLYRVDSNPRRNEMTVTVSRKDLSPQPALVIRRRIKAADIASTLAEILPKVYLHAQQHGIALAGPPFTRYLEVGPGLMTIEGGMAVATAAEAEGEIEPTELAGGPAAVAIHEGGYDTLPGTHAAIEQWIEGQGQKAGGAPWEVYVTDPGEYPDPEDWRTEVIWPLQA